MSHERPEPSIPSPVANRITEILEADAANAPAAVALLRALDPDLVDALETAGELFERYNSGASAAFSAKDDGTNDQLSVIAQEHGLSPAELIAKIESGDPAHSQAAALWQLSGVTDPQRFVLLLLHRYFRWGLASLLYLRLTPALGYQRLQAESLALLRLFVDQPARAQQWLRTGSTDGDGMKFFNETKGIIRSTITRYALANEYERGSATYQHVRPTSAVRGLSITPTETQLRDQEIDPEDPSGYYRVVLAFLNTQVKVFAHLPDAVPEVRCDDWRTSVSGLARRVDALWLVLELKHPLKDSEG
jgi:hypothetical protein